MNTTLKGEISLELDINGDPSSRALQVATVALLVDAAQASKGLQGKELSRIVGALFREFGLTDPEGAELLEIAELLLQQEGKREEFIEQIRTEFAPVQRAHVLSLVWRVIKADGDASKLEATFAAELRKKLELTLEQALRAQQVSAPPQEGPGAAPEEDVEDSI